MFDLRTPSNVRVSVRSIEEKIDIPDSRKDDFRREIMNYIGALALEGKPFDCFSPPYFV